MTGELRVATRQLRDAMGITTRSALDRLLARKRRGKSTAEAMQELLDEHAARLRGPEVLYRRPRRPDDAPSAG